MNTRPRQWMFLAPTALFLTPAAWVPATAWAETPTADTVDWKCSQCPFQEGYSADVEAGVLDARGANATFGRYTGIDHGGAYVDAASSGELRTADGAYASYDLERLGLASRDGSVEGGREGRYDLRLSYDGQPDRLYDTGATPFRTTDTTLSLPGGWVPGGTTGQMSALGASLTGDRIGSERRTVALLGRYFAGTQWTLFGEFRRQEHDGTGVGGASFLTDAAQFSQPFDYVTNSFEAGAAWAGRVASFRLTYTGSWFSDENDSITFANPSLPIVPGSTQGQLNVPPSNNLQQIAANGNVQLPWATTLTYTASLGSMKQNDAFLPVSTLPGSAPINSTSLDGNVHLSHYALTLASRPLPKLSLRGNAVYDGHDDKTRPQTIAYVVTDTFPGGSVVTPRYGEDRMHLDGGADYNAFRWLRIGVGGKLDEIHYGPGQVVSWTQNAESWGRATITPVAPLSFTLKIGNGLRKASSFDAAALPPEENPLIREYNYAPRDRVFSTLTGVWAATATLSWSLEASLAKDDYRSSPLGLQSTHEQRASTTLTWTPRDSLSAYVDAGYQRLFNLQDGSAGTDSLPWSYMTTDRLWDVGAGGRWVPQERWTLTLDYLLAPSYDSTDTTTGGQPQAFPQNWTKLNSTRFGVRYQWTPTAQVLFRYTREQFNSNDWALNGVGAATVPNLLALGLQPYRDNVNVFGLTVRYQFGQEDSKAK
jgi:MtrB/PioB family decaheme-associated outer membrane protein